MSEANLYSRLISPYAVEQAVVASLEVWMADYLGELERIEGYEPGQVELPRGILTSSQFDKWPEDQLPVILVINGGLAGPPVRRSDGKYECAWRVGVAPVVSDIDSMQTRRLGLTYATAIRAALLQHKLLKSPLHPSGFAQFTKWVDEKYSDIAFSETRSLSSGQVVFSIGVEDVVTEQAGPRLPSLTPGTDPGPLVDVTEVTVETESVPLAGVFS